MADTAVGDTIKSSVPPEVVNRASMTSSFNPANQSGSGQSYQWEGYDVFPADLTSSYCNHYMTLTAYATMGPSAVASSTNGGGTAVYSAALFMPGNGTAGHEVEHQHRYTDIKLSNVTGPVLGIMGGLAGAALGGVTGAIGGAKIGSAIGGMADAATTAAGHPINPHLEVLYQSTNLRDYNFVFLMAPSSEKESTSLKNMITHFRAWSAPELEANTGFWFNSPAIWEIKFMHNGKENTNIPKMRRAVMTDIKANYTPAGEWSTFSNGHPVAVMLSMSFVEMDIVHRKLISNEGY